MNLQLATYLASAWNKKVIYIAYEEKKGFTLQEKAIRLKASHKNLFFHDKLLKDYSPYDVVFFDSVNSLKLTPDDLLRVEAKNPKTSFGYIFQATKDGNFKGEQDFQHNVDVEIELKDGVAYTRKSRFGGNGELKIF